MEAVIAKRTGVDPIPSHTASRLSAAGVRHGFFTRNGGVSTGIYQSLNCGRGSKDDRAHVEENRARVAAALGVSATALIGPRQAHTARVVVAGAVWSIADAPEADGVVTRTPGLAIGVLSADCAPVLMADQQAKVIAAVHAGWKGAKAGIIEAAVAAMESQGANRGQIVAAIGPCISKAAYEVGPEFEAAFLSDDKANERFFHRVTPESKPHFDLPGYVNTYLEKAGIGCIETLALCTYENESSLFSHRRAVHRSEPDYGRQISAIVIA